MQLTALQFPYIMFSSAPRSLRAVTSKLCQPQTFLRFQHQPQLPRLHQFRMVTTHTLNTGAKIPAIGFGTWQDGTMLPVQIEDVVNFVLQVSRRFHRYVPLLLQDMFANYLQ
jgi:hypothetical protein